MMTSPATIRYAVAVCLLVVTCRHEPISAKPSGSREPTNSKDSVSEDYADLQKVLDGRLPGSTEENNIKIIDLLIQLLEEIDLPTLCQVIANDTTFVASTNRFNGRGLDENAEFYAAPETNKSGSFDDDDNLTELKNVQDIDLPREVPDTDNDQAMKGMNSGLLDVYANPIPYKGTGRTVRRRVIIPRYRRRFNNDGSIQFPRYRRPFPRIRPENLKKIPVPLSKIKGLTLDPSMMNNVASGGSLPEHPGMFSVPRGNGYLYKLINYGRPRSQPYSRSLILGDNGPVKNDVGMENNEGKVLDKIDVETSEGKLDGEGENSGKTHWLNEQGVRHNLLSRFPKPKGKIVRRVIYRKRKGDKAGKLGPIRYKIVRRIPGYGGTQGNDVDDIMLNDGLGKKVVFKDQDMPGSSYRTPLRQHDFLRKRRPLFGERDFAGIGPNKGDDYDYTILNNEVPVPGEKNVGDKGVWTKDEDEYKVNEYSLDNDNMVVTDIPTDLINPTVSSASTKLQEARPTFFTKSDFESELLASDKPKPFQFSDNAVLDTYKTPKIGLKPKPKEIKSKTVYDAGDETNVEFEDNSLTDEDIDNMIEPYRLKNDGAPKYTSPMDTDKYKYFESKIDEMPEDQSRAGSSEETTHYPFVSEEIESNLDEEINDLPTKTTIGENVDSTFIDQRAAQYQNTNISKEDGMIDNNNFVNSYNDSISSNATEEDYAANVGIIQKESIPSTLSTLRETTPDADENSSLMTEKNGEENELTRQESKYSDIKDETIRIISMKKNNENSNLIAESRVFSADITSSPVQQDLKSTVADFTTIIPANELLSLTAETNTTHTNLDDINTQLETDAGIEEQLLGDNRSSIRSSVENQDEKEFGTEKQIMGNTILKPFNGGEIDSTTTMNNEFTGNNTGENINVTTIVKGVDMTKAEASDSETTVGTGNDPMQHIITNETMGVLSTASAANEMVKSTKNYFENIVVETSSTKSKSLSHVTDNENGTSIAKKAKQIEDENDNIALEDFKIKISPYMYRLNDTEMNRNKTNLSNHGTNTSENEEIVHRSTNAPFTVGNVENEAFKAEHEETSSGHGNENLDTTISKSSVKHKLDVTQRNGENDSNSVQNVILTTPQNNMNNTTTTLHTSRSTNVKNISLSEKMKDVTVPGNPLSSTPNNADSQTQSDASGDDTSQTPYTDSNSFDSQQFSTDQTSEETTFKFHPKSTAKLDHIDSATQNNPLDSSTIKNSKENVSSIANVTTFTTYPYQDDVTSDGKGPTPNPTSFIGDLVTTIVSMFTVTEKITHDSLINSTDSLKVKRNGSIETTTQTTNETASVSGNYTIIDDEISEPVYEPTRIEEYESFTKEHPVLEESENYSDSQESFAFVKQLENNGEKATDEDWKVKVYKNEQETVTFDSDISSDEAETRSIEKGDLSTFTTVPAQHDTDSPSSQSNIENHEKVTDAVKKIQKISENREVKDYTSTEKATNLVLNGGSHDETGREYKRTTTPSGTERVIEESPDDTNSQGHKLHNEIEEVTLTTTPESNDLEDFNKRFINWNSVQNIVREDNLKKAGLDQLSRLHGLKHRQKPKTGSYKNGLQSTYESDQSDVSDQNISPDKYDIKHPVESQMDYWKAYNIAVNNDKNYKLSETKFARNWDNLQWGSNNDKSKSRYYDLPAYQHIGGRPSLTSYLHPDYYRHLLTDPDTVAMNREHEKDWGNRFSQGFYGRVNENNPNDSTKRQNNFQQFPNSAMGFGLPLSNHQGEKGYVGAPKSQKVHLDKMAPDHNIKSPHVIISSTNPDGDFSEEDLRKIMWSNNDENNLNFESGNRVEGDGTQNHNSVQSNEDFQESSDSLVSPASIKMDDLDKDTVDDVNDKDVVEDETEVDSNDSPTRPAGRHFGIWPIHGMSGPLGIPAPKDYKCPGMFGYHSDPLDCQAFFICSWGVPYRLHCPPGTRFNRDQSVCDWAVNVPCFTDYLENHSL